MLILTNLAEDLSTIIYCILHLDFILMNAWNDCCAYCFCNALNL